MASDLEVFMVGCVGVILNEIKQGCTQKQIALSYAFAINTDAAKVETVDWVAINTAITERWSKTGLERVKTMAWAYYPSPAPKKPTREPKPPKAVKAPATNDQREMF